MTINEIRTKYLAFYKERGHAIVPSASLVPQNDPTTLFTGSGMQPILPYLLGEPHPAGTRITDSQKSFRAEDIEEVGDNRHTTFFEMLGNWSFGDYFKKEQLPWIFEFLTSDVGIDPSKLYVTAFIGDPKNDLPKDEEAASIWKELFAQKGIEAKVVDIGSEADGYRLGMRDGRIFFYEAKKNWWSRAGTPEKMPAGEPGGPDSEIFYDFGTPHDPKYGPECHPNCDCGRFMEICNSVFMQYIKQGEGFALLPKQNVDFGGGLERIAAAANGDADVFKTDVFWDIILLLAHFSGKEYTDSRYQKSFRIIADHMRAAVFMLGDGVFPSHTDKGYILRRLIRRTIRHLDRLGANGDMLNKLAEQVLEKYGEHYPELFRQGDEIKNALREEEVRFRKTLATGLRYMHGMTELQNVKGATITGADAFILFSTYGFPIEITEEIAKERGMTVDIDGFNREMEQHQAQSRAGAEQKFKGGLADHSEKTTRLHTAHHLLLRALQQVLGPDVKQRGSNITQERLRIDFSYGAKMTKEQIAEVERIVNEKIRESLPVVRSTLPKEEAEKLGAEHEFGAKYPDLVSVYSVGPKEASAEDPHFKEAFSIEFCGGPHVQNTSELAGTFKIQKEEAVASGIRRIKAVLI